MAKIKTNNQEKTAVPDFKSVLFSKVGMFLAETMKEEADVVQLKKTVDQSSEKLSTIPACVLITVDGQDYCLTVTAKKNPVTYAAEDVVEDFTEKVLEMERQAKIKTEKVTEDESEEEIEGETELEEEIEGEMEEVEAEIKEAETVTEEEEMEESEE